jgi:hypothetical protein
MPTTLADMSDADRKALLNAHWDSLVQKEMASPIGTTTPIPSPVGGPSAVPKDLAAHLVPGSAGLTHAWNVYGLCRSPESEADAVDPAETAT